MAAATIVEKYEGTEYVAGHIYGAWWFSVLWALLAAVGMAYFVGQKVRRLSVVVLHVSMVVILVGALLTHLTGRQGVVHLREGQTTNRFLVTERDGMHEEELPFRVRLDRFSIDYHEGTRAAADYESEITIVSNSHESRHTVSMNNIYSKNNIRLYQSSFDDDMKGSYLAVNSDPWGIPVTYVGYALLFVALVWILIDPRGKYRTLLRKVQALETARLRTVITVFALCTMHSAFAQQSAVPTLPRDVADEFGRLCIVYNDRVCPLQTFAIDFTKKLYGKQSYEGYTAEQVLAGFIFYGDEWNKQPIIKVKGAVKSRLQLPKYCSVSTFFNSEMGGYILGPYIQEYYSGANDKFHKDAAKLDDRLQLIMELRQGKPLKVFPYTDAAEILHWYAPTDGLPETMEAGRQAYIQQIFAVLNGDAQAHNYERMREAIVKMQQYQQRYGAASIPSSLRVKAERAYNKVPFATILFMVNLTMGFVCLALTMMRRRQWLAALVMVLSFLMLTVGLSLRWIVTGHVPMSNGYETMLFMAWAIMLITLLMQRRFQVMLCFGFLLSGFFLLVSHINQMDPQISHIMPVLNSPLLSLHVSVIMMSFALLSLTFICGVAGLLARGKELSEVTYYLSQLFLFPALTCLGIGIFVGAIWANVSWGTYWSWDPKEVWALITFMIYAVAAHDRSLSFLRQPTGYHIYCVLAFLTLLMTYFGVNYFLGGMHSYA